MTDSTALPTSEGPNVMSVITGTGTGTGTGGDEIAGLPATRSTLDA